MKERVKQMVLLCLPYCRLDRGKLLRCLLPLYLAGSIPFFTVLHHLESSRYKATHAAQSRPSYTASPSPRPSSSA